MPLLSDAIRAFLARAYGLDATATRLAGENENYLVRANGGPFVLKLAAPGDGRDAIDLEHVAVEAVAAGGIDVDLPRLVPALDGSVVTAAPGGRFARLLTFVAGDAWGTHVPASTERLVHVGAVIARIARALGSVEHPAARRTHRWDLARAGELRTEVRLIDDAGRRRLADEAFERWAAARPDLAVVPRGLIHGDLNDDNLLVAHGRLCGVLDFGDALHNPLVCDLAIALAYLLLDEPDPWAAGARVVEGYHAVRPLTAAEVELLFSLVGGRLAVSLVTSAMRRRLDPDRAAWFVTEDRAWTFLARHGSTDPVEVADRLAERIDTTPYADRGVPAGALRDRRRAHVSAAQPLSYREPVKFVRGRGAYLLDERGRPHLDLYNNVCHVGHCHPRVVEAGQRQMARLNTNTRYLTDAHVAYAERLAATLPDALDTVFLVNSGTEANELALRLARAHVGGDDLLVVENAYHGHSTTLVAASPYKFMGPGGSGRPEPWVHVVPVPDGYRGPHRGQDRDAGVAYGDAVGSEVARLGRPVTFLAESLLSCGGQVIPPDGYFETVFRHVRAAGGVCILDEVQVGLGRVGTHFWAFEAQGVVPDVVVMGKPIGNGHPLAAVACTRAVAESFAGAGMEFFATFGGNPVSCAVGLAVLDVIEDEGLQAHALRVGAHFLASLRELMDRHAAVGDVRGAGLFLGVELVESRETRAPATEAARRLVDGLRQRRILTGTDGPYRNVVKIKPPLVVTEADADRAVTEMDALLAAL